VRAGEEDAIVAFHVASLAVDEEPRAMVWLTIPTS
jgi:hypothetical protein